MSLAVTDIHWDTDGVDAEELGLPSELSIDADAEGIDSHETLADWLSDKYGWTVSSLSCEPALTPVFGR